MRKESFAYERPEIQVIRFSTEDVITTSNTTEIIPPQDFDLEVVIQREP